MIKISIYKKNEKIVGIKTKGHAGYSESGSDIVCAAVSILVENTVNSIEVLTDAEFYGKAESGLVEFMLSSEPDEKTEILFKSMELGLIDICRDYSEYISIKFKEV